MTSAGIVVPIRAFALGKARLATRLGTSARAAFARRLADRVVDAAGDLPVLVVSSDPLVCEWATGRSLARIADPGSLDAAAADGCRWFREHGCTRVAIAHADLPRATTFEPVLRDGARPVVCAVPCHRDDGTPVLSLPADVEFPFAYGPGSFRAHARATRTLALGFRVVRDRDLGFDVDTVDDLESLAAIG